jgi:hypothetical protein
MKAHNMQLSPVYCIVQILSVTSSIYVLPLRWLPRFTHLQNVLYVDGTGHHTGVWLSVNNPCSFPLGPSRRKCGCLFEARLAGGSLKRSNNKRTLFSVNIRASFYCSSCAPAVTHRGYVDFKSHCSNYCVIRTWFWLTLSNGGN